MANAGHVVGRVARTGIRRRRNSLNECGGVWKDGALITGSPPHKSFEILVERNSLFLMRMNMSFGLLVACLLLVSCSSGSSYSRNSGYENTRKEAMGNPYSEGTGHYAGYEWAERTGGDCNGNSQSFNEGCEEYYEQSDQ